jgi:hypothetical protein
MRVDPPDGLGRFAADGGSGAHSAVDSCAEEVAIASSVDSGQFLPIYRAAKAVDAR